MAKFRVRKYLAQAFVFVALLFVAAATHADDSRQSGKHTLWRIKTEHNTVYLLGSLHLLKSSNYPLAEAIEGAFADSEVMVFELDLGEADDPTVQLMMMSKGTLPEGATLQQQLSNRCYDLAKKKAAELGTDISMFQSFEPWLFAVTLASLKLLMLGFDPACGVDRHLFSRAQHENKAIIGLETMDFQARLFDELSTADQETIVYQTLLDLDIIEKEMESIVKAWSEGDAPAMERVLLKSFREYPSIYQRFFVERNRNWIKKITPLFERSEDCMIVVGAGHLVGADGLVSLLRKQGHAVEQL